MLQHLHNGWQVDQAILSEEDRTVVSLEMLLYKHYSKICFKTMIKKQFFYLFLLK